MNPFGSDGVVGRYGRGRPYHHRRTVARVLGDSRPGRALDVACGTGLSTRALVELGIPAVGVDVVPAMVAAARAAGLPVAVAAAEALPVRDASVDLVTVSSGVHWFDPARFGAEAARVLRPGGALLLYEHAGADLPGEPAYRDWLRGTYLARHPPPPPRPAGRRGHGARLRPGRRRWLAGRDPVHPGRVRRLPRHAEQPAVRAGGGGPGLAAGRAGAVLPGRVAGGHVPRVVPGAAGTTG